MTRSDEMDGNQLDPKIDAAVLRCLETPPVVVVPAAFAGRVRAALPAPTPRRQRVSAGQQAGVAAVVLLLVAVFWLAPHTAPRFTSMAFDVEIMLLLELAGVLAWLANRHRDV